MEPLLLTWSSVLWRSMQSSNGPVYTSLHRHRQLLIERSPTLMPAMSVRGPSGGFFKLFFLLFIDAFYDLLSISTRLTDFVGARKKFWNFCSSVWFLFLGQRRGNIGYFSHLDGNGNFWSNRSVSLNLHCFHFEFSLALLECGRVSVTTVPTGCCHCRRHLSISDAFSQLWNSRILLMPPPFNPLKFYRGNTFFIVQTVSVVSHQGPVWILESPLSLIYFLSFF